MYKMRILNVRVCYLGDLEGVPSVLLGSSSLCSCFCRVILSVACLHDKSHTQHIFIALLQPAQTVLLSLKFSLLLSDW